MCCKSLRPSFVFMNLTPGLAVVEASTWLGWTSLKQAQTESEHT